ncbi:hypothetical protein [Polaribacter sp. L3A8]|uniref:hypothetical protein n=1 Tax=Polaribacter sp. L3A8 TaxID=2686361 RepID=UPI00131B5C62|nr:hypothetical protein [Polaribacter sp. L3A8]
MILNNKSLCNTCIHTIDCSLTSNKNAIWSCSEYEKRNLDSKNSTSILTPGFSFIEGERELEIM